jgi:hypothetical protein
LIARIPPSEEQQTFNTTDTTVLSSAAARDETSASGDQHSSSSLSRHDSSSSANRAHAILPAVSSFVLAGFPRDTLSVQPQALLQTHSSSSAVVQIDDPELDLDVLDDAEEDELA